MHRSSLAGAPLGVVPAVSMDDLALETEVRDSAGMAGGVSVEFNHPFNKVPEVRS